MANYKQTKYMISIYEVSGDMEVVQLQNGCKGMTNNTNRAQVFHEISGSVNRPFFLGFACMACCFVLRPSLPRLDLHVLSGCLTIRLVFLSMRTFIPPKLFLYRSNTLSNHNLDSERLESRSKYFAIFLLNAPNVPYVCPKGPSLV